LAAQTKTTGTEELMNGLHSNLRFVLLLLVLWAAPVLSADIIVSAQDGKFVRVEGRATFPNRHPPTAWWSSMRRSFRLS
jgi:hypothetical protein